VVNATGARKAQGTPGAPQKKEWSNGMNLKTWLAGFAAALTLGLVAVSAEAAPAGSVTGLTGAAAQTADVQPAHYYGRRHYRRYHYHPRHHYRYRYYHGHRYHRRHWRHRHW
jgi:hypothetical protein